MFKGEDTPSCIYTLTFTDSLPSINEREIVGQAFPPAFSMGSNQEWLPYNNLFFDQRGKVKKQVQVAI
jgi:hypothetical protein